MNHLRVESSISQIPLMHMEMRKKFTVYNRTRVSQSDQIDNNRSLSLEIQYSSDYNILELDEQIRNIIQVHDRNQCIELKKNLDDVQRRIDESDIIIEMRQYEVERAGIVFNLSKLEQQDMLKNYISLSTPLLTKYRDIPMGDRIVDTMNISQANTEEEIIRERAVDAYMQVVLNLRLPQVTIVKEKRESRDKTEVCSSCNSYLIGCDVLLSGYIICSNCRSTNKPKSSSSTPKEYDILSNFMKAYRRYIGSIPPKCDMNLVLSDLDKYFTSRGEPDGSHYRSLPLDEWGGKEGTSPDRLCAALKDLCYDELYKNYRYIGHHYYGWQLFDLRHIEDIMIRNFRIKHATWDNLMSDADKGYRSSLSTEYRLCRELQHAGHNCRLIDFKIPRKKTTLERYDKSYAIMCSLSGFQDIFSME